MLYETQSSWANERNAEDKFIQYAESLDLNIDQFKADMNSDEAKEKVANDNIGGARSGVQGTPTFFLNGEKITNPRNYDELKTVVEQALNQ